MTKKGVFLACKKKGETPLELIKRLKEKYPHIRGEKTAYAGRLDPLAEGMVLIISGEKLKDFNRYLHLDKEYEAEIIFGFSSDTYDILGVPQKGGDVEDKEKVKKILKSMEGDFSFSIPPFSSYNIKGRPLFWWAREKRLKEVKIPQKKVKIYSLKVLSFFKLKKGELKREVLEVAKKVKGDFRQEEIKREWQRVLKKEKKEAFPGVKIYVSCSSGCYIRSVAEELGKRLKKGAVVFRLKRTRIGGFPHLISERKNNIIYFI